MVEEVERRVTVSHLDDLLRVPHGVLKLAVVALLALLAVQLEQHIPGVGGVVEVEPEDHAPFHGGPPVTALLENTQPEVVQHPGTSTFFFFF